MRRTTLPSEFNDTNQDGNNFSIIGVDGASTATINYGAAFPAFTSDSTGEFLSQSIDNLIINVNNLGGGLTSTQTPAPWD